MRTDAQNTGFTLVEVLVALVVTAILLAILMNGATVARSRGGAADEKRRAVLLASSVLDQAVASGMEGPSNDQGQQGRLRWTVERVSVVDDPRRLVALVAWRVSVFGAAGNRLIVVPTRRLVTLPRA